MPAAQWLSLLQTELENRDAAHRLRSRTTLEHVDAVRVRCDGKTYVNFCGNNYLGLTHHPRMLQALRGARATGSGAAGLISGYSTELAAAESELARWKGCESAVLLPSGYQANTVAIQTLASLRSTGGVRFLVDKLAHASLIDAIHATNCPMRIFPHNQYAKLERLLAASPSDQVQIIVTESIFSMDGDAVDLVAIAQLKQRFPFVLLLDEAHATGVCGPEGSGLAAELGLRQAVDVSIVTLSKALGCLGGAACGPKVFTDALLNHGRAYIYSTAVAPFVGALLQCAIDICRTEPQRRARLAQITQRVRTKLQELGFSQPGGSSPIIPLIAGEEKKALDWADQLRGQGLLVLPIRPPTVPAGASRLRVTLSCEHSDAQTDSLLAAVSRLR